MDCCSVTLAHLRLDRGVRRTFDLLVQARMLFATGWAGLSNSVRGLDSNPTVGRIKEGTGVAFNRGLDGLSKVRETGLPRQPLRRRPQERPSVRPGLRICAKCAYVAVDALACPRHIWRNGVCFRGSV